MNRAVPITVAVALLLGNACSEATASTINPANKYSYGDNIGWMDWRPSQEHGVAIGEYVCSGYIYAPNVGWIHLGSGSPANGVRYQNNSATDYGVNHDGGGNLRGLAYGANIGWLNFESTGAPSFDLITGQLNGFVWGENVGWISLSTAVASVQTVGLQPSPDSDADGIPDSWEVAVGLNPNDSRDAGADADNDGRSNAEEYRADTHPLDPRSNLASIDARPISGVGPSPMMAVTWLASPTRFYRVEMRDRVGSESDWVDIGVVIDPSKVSGVGPSPLQPISGVGPSPLYPVFGVGPSPMHPVYGVGPSPMRPADGVGPSPLHPVFGVGPSPLRIVFGVGPSPLRLFRLVADQPFIGRGY